MDNSRKTNVVGFDHEAAVKKSLPIASAITAVDLPNGQSILLFIHEAIYNDTSNHALLSEFQIREHGILIDSTYHRHGGTQRLTITDSNHHDDFTIPLELAGCMVHFKHRLPTKKDMMSLQQYCLTQGDTPWNPSILTDQVVDVLDTESNNANSMKLFPYDPSDTYENIIIGKPAILSFCPKMIMKVQDSQTLSTSTDPYSTVLNYSKVLPSSVDYESLSPYFVFIPHDMIQNILRQPGQLANSIIHYPLRFKIPSHYQPTQFQVIVKHFPVELTIKDFTLFCI
jgi:hypothetical protein